MLSARTVVSSAVPTATSIDLAGISTALVLVSLGTTGETLSASKGIYVDLEESDDNATFTSVAANDVQGEVAGINTQTAGYQIVNVGGAVSGGDATGLANDTTAYTATVVIDGVSKAVSVVGSAAQTITNLISEINTDIGAAGTASLTAGNIKITSATTGLTSSVAITDSGSNHLFATLTAFVAILTAVAGTQTNYPGTIVAVTANGNVSKVYKAGYFGSKRYIKPVLRLTGTQSTGTQIGISVVQTGTNWALV